MISVRCSFGTERTVRPLTPESEMKLEQVLLSLLKYYQTHGLNLRASCQDQDRHNIGVITESQVQFTWRFSKVVTYGLASVFEVFLLLFFSFIARFRGHRKWRSSRWICWWRSIAIPTDQVSSTTWTSTTTWWQSLNASHEDRQSCTQHDPSVTSSHHT